MVIKCFFISSQATTMVQNRIKQSGGTLPLLMLRPFENVLATRRATSLQARITEQSDGEIQNEVWELSSTFLTFKHLQCFPYHPYVLVATSSPHSPCVMSTLCVTRQVSADDEQQQQTHLSWEQRHSLKWECKWDTTCKLDERASKSSNERIHYFLKSSSRKDYAEIHTCYWKRASSIH